MPPPSTEKVVENIRRTLHAGLSHYAALFPETLDEPGEDELVELSLVLGVEWPGAASTSKAKRERKQIGLLLRTLSEAAREDQQATYEKREAARLSGADPGAIPLVTVATDHWLERWLTGKERKRS
ncbi:MAG: hypothetical protein ACLQJR_29410 [Stellaceae bacterium]